MPPTAVELHDVRKRFGRFGEWVLDGVALRLEPGSVAVVVGANGAGKSTLLRIIGGLTRPTSGRIDRERVTIGYAPDRLGARVRMSAHTYVEHMARLRACTADGALDDGDRLLARLGLLPGPDAPIRTLSKGNSQKVALAQALIAPVDVLLLDEPYGGLDGRARDTVSTIIAERSERGAAVVVTAHQPLVDIDADRTLYLQDGRLVSADTAGTRRVVRIALTPTDTATDADAIRTHPGVVRVAGEPGATLALRVDVGASDAFLAFALANGWSVVSVTA